MCDRFANPANTYLVQSFNLVAPARRHIKESPARLGAAGTQQGGTMKIKGAGLLLLCVSFVSSMSAASAQPVPRQPERQTPTTRPPLEQQKPSPLKVISLSQLAVQGPVVGSNNAQGLVRLTEPVPRDHKDPLGFGAVVGLRSSNPAVVSVPPNVNVPVARSDQSFTVTTFPVTTPTTVTISAQLGADVKTSALTVLPPSLKFLSCAPTTIPVGTNSRCTVWLNGDAPADTNVPTSSPDGVSVGAAWVKKGARSDGFHVHGSNAGPQPRTITVNASFGGVTKSTQLTVGPAILENIAITETRFRDRIRLDNDRAHGGEFYAVLWVKVHAPAPPGGLRLKLTAEPPTVVKEFGNHMEWDRVGGSTVIDAGKTFGEFFVIGRPMDSDTPVKILVLSDYQGSNDIKFLYTTVRAARLSSLFCGLSGDRKGCQGEWRLTADGNNRVRLHAIPTGGLVMKVEAWLEGLAPLSGGTIRLSYSSDPPSLVTVTGPASVTIPKNNVAEDFRVTVYPCPEGECHGTIRGTYLNQSLDLTVTVTP